tara:strand:+ start:211 stop:432 length:222 start_codon:yes stop_codon:yes gene_type:complete
MADKSILSRLQRLFSTDVIIRNVGGNQLKVADINQIQVAGELENNSSRVDTAVYTPPALPLSTDSKQPTTTNS